MPKDYYKILNINKNASKDEIKKAFRKLAHQYHPDKSGGDAAKFKEASEAYSVLSDDSKRAHYDQFGSAPHAGHGTHGGQGGGYGGFGGQGGAGGGFGGFDFSGFQQGFGGGFQQNGEGGFSFDLGDIFGDFFGGGRGGRGGTGGQGDRSKRGADIAVDVELTFKDTVYGVDKKIALNKNSTCTRCKGAGNEPGTELKNCDNCKGKGQIKDVRQSIFGSIAVNRECEVCHGAGKIPREKCKTCRGLGIENKREEFMVHIPAGIEDNEAVRVQGAGEAVTGGTSGDLYIRVHIQKTTQFKKDGNNIQGIVEIKLSDALLGGDKSVETVDGPLTIAIPAGISHGETLRIKNHGFLIGAGPKRGDLLLKVSIEIPKKLSKNARNIIENLKREGL